TFALDSSRDTRFSLMIPLRNQKQYWPTSEDRFVQVLLEKAMNLSVLPGTTTNIPVETPKTANHKCGKNVKQLGLMAYCRMQRKLSLVDSVLYREMMEDEHRYSFQSAEVAQIRQQLIMSRFNLNANMMPPEYVNIINAST